MMPTRPPFAVCMAVAIQMSCLFVPQTTIAQLSTDYVPGKMYVIRVSDLSPSKDTLEAKLTSVREAMDEGRGLLAHVQDNLIIVKEAQGGQWFIGYFDVDRQSRDQLTRDMDLLTWYFHGHQGLIYPLEALESPWPGNLAHQQRKR